MADIMQVQADNTVAAQESNTGRAAPEGDTGTELFETTSDDTPVFTLPPEEDGETQEEPEAEAPKGQEQDTETRKSRLQKRIDSLVSGRESEKIKAEKLQQELDALKSQEPDEIKQSDFDTYSEYLDALEEQEQAQKTQQDKPKDGSPKEAEGKAPELTEDQRIALAVLKEKFEDFDSRPDDFYDVIESQEVPITPTMIEALAASDNAADIAYTLGKNPKLAQDIASGSVAQQMRSIAKLDFDTKPKPQKPAKISKAPDPISPVGGTVDAGQKPLKDLSFTEHENRRIQESKVASRDGW